MNGQARYFMQYFIWVRWPSYVWSALVFSFPKIHLGSTTCWPCLLNYKWKCLFWRIFTLTGQSCLRLRRNVFLFFCFFSFFSFFFIHKRSDLDLNRHFLLCRAYVLRTSGLFQNTGMRLLLPTSPANSTSGSSCFSPLWGLLSSSSLL